MFDMPLKRMFKKIVYIFLSDIQKLITNKTLYVNGWPGALECESILTFLPRHVISYRGRVSINLQHLCAIFGMYPSIQGTQQLAAGLGAAASAKSRSN